MGVAFSPLRSTGPSPSPDRPRTHLVFANVACSREDIRLVALEPESLGKHPFGGHGACTTSIYDQLGPPTGRDLGCLLSRADVHPQQRRPQRLQASGTVVGNGKEFYCPHAIRAAFKTRAGDEGPGGTDRTSCIAPREDVAAAVAMPPPPQRETASPHVCISIASPDPRRRTFPVSSRATTVQLVVSAHTPAIEEGSMAASAMAARVASPKRSHHSSGLCSAHAG